MRRVSKYQSQLPLTWVHGFLEESNFKKLSCIKMNIYISGDVPVCSAVTSNQR